VEHLRLVVYVISLFCSIIDLSDFETCFIYVIFMISRRNGGVDCKNYISGSCVLSGLIAKKLVRNLRLSSYRFCRICMSFTYCSTDALLTVLCVKQIRFEKYRL
jgi:hypothetical protein